MRLLLAGSVVSEATSVMLPTLLLIGPRPVQGPTPGPPFTEYWTVWTISTPLVGLAPA